MSDKKKLARFNVQVMAALVRDIETAGLLSDTTRKVIFNGLAEVRDVEDEDVRAALAPLEDLTPPADG